MKTVDLEASTTCSWHRVCIFWRPVT